MNLRKENELRLLVALFCLAAFSANALVIEYNQNKPAVTRSQAVTSATPTFFRLRNDRGTVIEVSGTGTATLKVSTLYNSPTTFVGFTPDSQGAVTGNTGWQFPAGLGMVGLDVTSGTWNINVAQPQ